MIQQDNKDDFITLSGMKISREDWYTHADEYLEIHYIESKQLAEFNPNDYSFQSINRMMT